MILNRILHIPSADYIRYLDSDDFRTVSSDSTIESILEETPYLYNNVMGRLYLGDYSSNFKYHLQNPAYPHEFSIIQHDADHLYCIQHTDGSPAVVYIDGEVRGRFYDDSVFKLLDSCSIYIRNGGIILIPDGSEIPKAWRWNHKHSVESGEFSVMDLAASDSTVKQPTSPLDELQLDFEW